jgi:hypothetical protein
MTEDDTFRILARPSVHEMVRLDGQRTRMKPYCAISNIVWAKEHGWQWGEYQRARKAAGYNYDDGR